MDIGIWILNLFLWLLLVGVGCKVAVLLSDMFDAIQRIVDALHRLELLDYLEDDET